MLFNNSLRRESHVFVCTFVYKVSKRSLYLCVLNKLSRRLRDEDLQKHKLCCFRSCNLVPYRSFVVELIIYTFGMGCVSVFLRNEFDINHVINKSSCDWYKFSLITAAAIFLTRKHLKYACLYAKCKRQKN